MTKIPIPSLLELSAEKVGNVLNETTDIDSYIESFKEMPEDFLLEIAPHMNMDVFFKFAKQKEFSNVLSKKLFLQNINKRENRYREFFARDRNNSVLDNITKNKTKMRKQIPAVFEFIYKPLQGIAVVPKEEFLKRFEIFTAGQLKHINWNNVIVAGGAVAGSLVPLPAEFNTGKLKDIRKFYGKDSPYEQSDVDMFIYGLNEEQATQKVISLLEEITENHPNSSNIHFVKKKCVVTLCSADPFRHIQIIFRLYKSPAEVLMGFDIDSCCALYNGETVMIGARFYRAITKQYNLFDATRRSPSYENRLFKYSRRGFMVLVPGLDRKKINPKIYDRLFGEVHGLARLLLLEKFYSPDDRYEHVMDSLSHQRYSYYDNDEIHRRFKNYYWSRKKDKVDEGMFFTDPSQIGEISWMVVDPGRQMIGPINLSTLTEQEWFEQAYKDYPEEKEEKPKKRSSRFYK
ncbi:hypothetical protein M0811_13323 [Anaeramoeba ignava]|uniref:Uncharacterized protein n=1 Tax=Anaeramoeba ignava TaxID=1746090 RepID=A0A9Q0R5G2_ANAIG|nr:hypothetical protein M0811_13323 [Anaeramoeba ignava]